MCWICDLCNCRLNHLEEWELETGYCKCCFYFPHNLIIMINKPKKENGGSPKTFIGCRYIVLFFSAYELLRFDVMREYPIIGPLCWQICMWCQESLFLHFNPHSSEALDGMTLMKNNGQILESLYWLGFCRPKTRIVNA